MYLSQIIENVYVHILLPWKLIQNYTNIIFQYKHLIKTNETALINCFYSIQIYMEYLTFAFSEL